MFDSRFQPTVSVAILFIAALPQAYGATSSNAVTQQPDVTLLLGCGLIAIGLLSKRKRPR
ncbi:MAG: hypothetical protein ABI806_24710 [Candidatus Solibacter sp.]